MADIKEKIDSVIQEYTTELERRAEFEAGWRAWLDAHVKPPLVEFAKEIEERHGTATVQEIKHEGKFDGYSLRLTGKPAPSILHKRPFDKSEPILTFRPEGHHFAVFRRVGSAFQKDLVKIDKLTRAFVTEYAVDLLQDALRLDLGLADDA